MAFDQTTRDRLNDFVGDARDLLTREFTRQLQQDYGLDPNTGEATELDRLDHLDDGRLATARLLREILAHYLATEAGSDRRTRQPVLNRIVREQAFTVLNRLAALRTMEARGLLLESVGHGYRSKGFQLYELVAGNALGETGEAYRCYLFSLFDEFALDREVWAWEQSHGPGSLLPSPPGGRGVGGGRRSGDGENIIPLCQTYADEAAFLLDVPRLIIEHNIHGVEIDPRAAQIASLALWLRAQRAWHDAGMKATDRPTIERGNVVAAIAPPAEIDLRKALMAKMDELDAEQFEQTLFMLKGLPELGVLLQVERELPALIRQVYGEHGPMFREADEEQWRKAEARLRAALTEFARAIRSTYQARLFAEDALEGLRLIDLTRETFDAVVMNPPFGALSQGVKDGLGKAYPRSKNDLLAIFVERGLELLRPGGRLGAITSRTCFFLSSFRKWREQVVLGTGRPEVMADLGHGVMDDAMVEAAAYCLCKQ